MALASLMERTLRGESVERAPVWAMRQAGRWDPEFRRRRAGRDFFELNRHPELAAELSLCPLRFGVDAIILFYDITTLAIAMGQEFDLVPEKGPVPRRPIRSLDDVASLSAHPDPERYQPIVRLLELVRSALPETIPALVFAGAPFTLATYQIGAGKDLELTRRFIQEQPKTWHGLLEKITSATVDFLSALLSAGALAYQLFDSWAGALTRTEYLHFAQPFQQRLFSEVGESSILFVKDSPYLDLMAESGAKVISLGTSTPLEEARARYPQLVFQGNVDHRILIDGSTEEVRRTTKECLLRGGGRRHILNLDHGMDRRARVENFEAFVDSAKSP